MTRDKATPTTASSRLTIPLDVADPCGMFYRLNNFILFERQKPIPKLRQYSYPFPPKPSLVPPCLTSSSTYKPIPIPIPELGQGPPYPQPSNPTWISVVFNLKPEKFQARKLGSPSPQPSNPFSVKASSLRRLKLQARKI
ncbi:hypothetical protein I3760_14G048300 [Carya illinoinensis]|nr:hypothetical protein I3760_14G048300 [Carya illinoinensis]